MLETLKLLLSARKSKYPDEYLRVVLEDAELDVLAYTGMGKLSAGLCPVIPCVALVMIDHPDRQGLHLEDCPADVQDVLRRYRRITMGE